MAEFPLDPMLAKTLIASEKYKVRWGGGAAAGVAGELNGAGRVENVRAAIRAAM